MDIYVPTYLLIMQQWQATRLNVEKNEAMYLQSSIIGHRDQVIGMDGVLQSKYAEFSKLEILQEKGIPDQSWGDQNESYYSNCPNYTPGR